jgi:hypothetical protein
MLSGSTTLPSTARCVALKRSRSAHHDCAGGEEGMVV